MKFILFEAQMQNCFVGILYKERKKERKKEETLCGEIVCLHTGLQRSIGK
jgi:hypothetical protein